MSRASPRAKVVFSHLVATLLGFGLAAVVVGHEAATRSLGTPLKKLGAALAALGPKPTREAILEASASLSATEHAVGERAASILELRLLTISAASSGSESDVARAMEACHARKWPLCDRASILAMGAE